MLLAKLMLLARSMLLAGSMLLARFMLLAKCMLLSTAQCCWLHLMLPASTHAAGDFHLNPTERLIAQLHQTHFLPNPRSCTKAIVF
jgi:hypothetical protein